MGFRSRLAVLCAKSADRLIRRLKIGNGGSFPGYVAELVDPGILGRLAGMVREKVIVVVGTNGKTTTAHILCHVLEKAGKKVVSNRTGANMVNGIVTAFVLAADGDAGLDADYACIEVDEFAATEVFSRLEPHCVVVTNIFRDQLDRFGEVDAVLDRLKGAVRQVPDAVLVLNGDDAVSYSLAYECRNPVVSYGLEEHGAEDVSQGKAGPRGALLRKGACGNQGEAGPRGAFLRKGACGSHGEKDEEGFGDSTPGCVRESAICRRCGEPLEYDSVHYGQPGRWHCPRCGARRPKPDYSGENVSCGKGGFAFDVKGPGMGGLAMKASGMGSLRLSGVKFAYNLYNILAAYGALDAMNVSRGFGEAMTDFDYGNRRESMFTIGGGRVQLHLAKNPMGLQQKLSFLQEDPEPKDVIIQINDTDLDGRDVSWLWDVDFRILGNVNARQVVVGGTRRYDMGLRLKYEGLLCGFSSDLRDTVRRLAGQGTGNLYVIVNYSGLYRTNRILWGLQGGYRHEADHRTFISEAAQPVR